MFMSLFISMGDNLVKHFFKLEELGTTVSREIIAGITTFLTMAYIIFVNPNILSETGMDKGALITATILASAFGTLLVGLWANVPFAMAPGMGLNAAFTYALVMGKGISWQTGLGVVFMSGVFFFLLTVCGIRAKVVKAIPVHMRLGIAAGIGLFITFIGFQKLGLVVDHPVTLVHMLDKFTLPVVLGLTGLAAITLMEVKRIKGSILIGVVLTTVLALIFIDEVRLPLTADAGENAGLLQHLRALVCLPPSFMSVFMKVDIVGALRWGLLGSIFSFMFVDLFDSVGTIVACSYEAGLVEEDGSIKKIDKILTADAVATVAGALLGTSTTTTYIESGAGIAQGGRSGLASVVTAALFICALFVTPLIAIVPEYATAPALIVVGVYMFKSVLRIDFHDFEVALPAFFTIILMPLTYSISTGISFGFVSYILVMMAVGKIRTISLVMWVIGVLSATDIVLSAV